MDEKNIDKTTKSSTNNVTSKVEKTSSFDPKKRTSTNTGNRGSFRNFARPNSTSTNPRFDMKKTATGSTATTTTSTEKVQRNPNERITTSTRRFSFFGGERKVSDTPIENREPRTGSSMRTRQGLNSRPTFGSNTNELLDNLASHILYTRRVTKVVKGGKNMSFYVLSVVGNKKGSVGIGEGKSRTIINAINKSFHNARKNMIEVGTIRTMRHHFKSTQLILKKNKDFQIIASNHLYNIFSVAGISGVSCKIVVSRNIINAVKCLFECLQRFRVVSTDNTIKTTFIPELKENKEKVKNYNEYRSSKQSSIRK